MYEAAVAAPSCRHVTDRTSAPHPNVSARMTDSSITVRFDEKTHKYWIDGEEVPSVSTILDETLPKPALTWWGFRVGMAAVMQMCKLGKVSWPALCSLDFDEIKNNAPSEPMFMPNDKSGKKPRTLLEHWALLLKLHPNAIRDEAGTRGTSIHEALVQLGMGIIPDVWGVDSPFPLEDRPVVAGLIRWYIEQEPEFVVQEQIVASKKHGFAGRFDLIVRRPNGNLAMVDLKTSKSVYPDSHFRQLKGYEIAWLENGGEPLDELVVLHVDHAGDYREHQVRCMPQHFLMCLEQLKSMRDFNDMQRKTKLKRAA